MKRLQLRKMAVRIMLVCSLILGGLPSTKVANPVLATVAVAEAAAYSKATIKEVQKKLNKKGYDCGTPDGIAGKATKAAIKKYQKAKGLTVNKTLLKSLKVKESTVSASVGEKKEVTVYITETGKKYHTGGCRYLSKSKIAISLEDAKKNYTPCSVCKP